MVIIDMPSFENDNRQMGAYMNDYRRYLEIRVKLNREVRVYQNSE